jgi:hypothetical protein
MGGVESRTLALTGMAFVPVRRTGRLNLCNVSLMGGTGLIRQFTRRSKVACER